MMCWRLCKLFYIYVGLIYGFFMNNRLYCTFVPEENIENTVDRIKTSYSILFNKIFVLESLDGEKIMLTYNVDMNNSRVDSMMDNTILVHRKKQTNTLYTINALNELIKKLNDGVVDTKYQVDWQHYRNCILLTQHNELKQLNTKIFKIIEI